MKRVRVGNDIYVQAADPQRDKEYRQRASDLIEKLQASLPEALHYEWKDTTIFDKPVSYALVWFDVGEVDPDYDDLIIYFLPEWRGRGHASGEYKHKDTIVWEGKDSIAIWGLMGPDPQNKEVAVDGVEFALRNFRDTLIHELIHYYDQKRYPVDKRPKIHKAPDPRYYNSPQEFNAFFQAWADLQDKRLQRNVFDEAEPGTLLALSKFHVYFSDDPERFARHEASRGAFKNLDPKMRRHFLKRAYQLWQFLRDKVTAGKDLPSPAAAISNEKELRSWLQTVADEVRIGFAEEWGEWTEEEYWELPGRQRSLIRSTQKDLFTIMSDPEVFLDLAQDYSGTGAEWIVKSLPAEYQGDYLEAMEQLRLELLAEYKAPFKAVAAARVKVGSRVYRRVKAESDIVQLFCFDFDNCLFKSPDRPDWWPHRAWWSNEESLQPPLVPEQPSAAWWRSDVVSEAKEAIADDTVYTVMVTGRTEDKFASRITDLLKQKGLVFDELRFKVSSKEKTDDYKARHIRSIAKKFPQGLDRIQVWDDMQENLDAVKNRLEERGYDVVTHYVEPEMHEVACTEAEYNEQRQDG